MGRTYLDFAAIKSRVPVLDVLDRYGFQMKRVQTDQFKATCRLPSHTSKDPDTFCVNTSKRVWCCKSDSCRKAGNGSSGNIIDLVAALDGTQAYEAAAKLADWYPELIGEAQVHRFRHDGAAMTKDNRKLEEPPASPTPPQPEINRPLAFQLQGITHAHELIQSRGITEETAKAFGAGWFTGKGSMSGRVVFPLYEDGQLIGYAGRTTLDVTDENPKWRVPKNLVKSFLYSGPFTLDPSKPLAIVEGCWAVLWLHQNGQQAAALLGKELTPAQEARLEPFGTIIIALDNDEAGIAATEKLVAKLKPRHKVIKAHLMA